MGTYTTNKELYKPSVGENGWGTLVNGNFETIDNFLKPITVSGSTYTFTGNHVGNLSGGSISATSISNSGTLTNTGKITANGGIGTTSLTTSSTITSTGKITANGGIVTKALTATTGTFSGAVTGASFNSIPIKTSGTITVTPTNTYYNIPSSSDYNTSPIILPFLPGSATYTGSIKVKMQTGSSGTAFSYATDKESSGYISLDVGEIYTISFSGVKWLRVSYSRSGLIDYCTMSGFTLS